MTETNDTSETNAVAARPSRVRFAEPCDFDALMDLCCALHQENGLFEMSRDRVREMLMKHFDMTGGMIGVIGPPGALEGAIVMHMSQMWYSDDWLLEELFSYVKPEFRRSSNATDLIEFAKACAERIGVPLLIGIISNTRTEAKVGLYRRRLGTPAGAFFVANVGGARGPAAGLPQSAAAAA